MSNIERAILCILFVKCGTTHGESTNGNTEGVLRIMALIICGTKKLID